MNETIEHKEIVKKTVFEELDTVNKLKPKQIDGLIKLNSLFSPSFAFSDTQLIDNKGFRDLYSQKPTQITKKMFDEDSASDAIGQTIEVCYRPQGKKGEEIDFRKVIENMIEKSKEPMLFSSLNPNSNKKLENVRKNHGKVNYNEFIRILEKTEPTEVEIFNSYIEWLNEIFNKKNHCSKKEWSFQNYSELVTNVIKQKEELGKSYKDLRTPSASEFHCQLKKILKENPDRTPLIKELQNQFKLKKIKKTDKEIYEQIINFPYNYNLAKSHNYAFTQKTRHKDITKLFYEAGLLGSKSLERTKEEQIDKFKKKFKKPKLFKIKKTINLKKINYDHIQMIRTSSEFRDLLINRFLNNEDLISGCRAFEEYYKFLLRVLPTEKLNSEVFALTLEKLPWIIGLFVASPEIIPYIIILNGVIYVIQLRKALKQGNQIDRDTGRT